MNSFKSVILDCNQLNWAFLISKHQNTDQDFPRKILASTISLCNSHLFTSLNNRLVVIPGAVKLTKYKFLLKESQKARPLESLESFFLDVIRNSDAQLPHYSAALSLSICAFQRFKKQYPNSTGSITIINLTDDLSNEQNSLMNLFFASRQYSLRVDVVSLNGAVPILQQASDITGGVHTVLDDADLLTQTLMGMSSNTFDGQNALFNRMPSNIDYRAVCHCHNQLLSIGWVCSVCLSLTCNFVPFCKTCNAVFPRPIQNQQKRATRKID